MQRHRNVSAFCFIQTQGMAICRRAMIQNLGNITGAEPWRADSSVSSMTDDHRAAS